MYETSNKISLKFVPKGLIDNIPSLVEKMAWRRPGDKPLSQPMMVRLQRTYASLGLNELSTEIPIIEVKRSWDCLLYNENPYTGEAISV